MALGKYVMAQTYTIPAGTAATVVAGEPETAGAAGFGSAAVTPATYTIWPQTILAGTPLVLDSAGPLYALLNTAGVLRAYVQGQDDVGHAALAN